MGPISSTGGTINPGTGATGTGILNSGNLTLNSTTSFNLALNDVTAGTGYDQVNVTGTVNLASSALNLTLGFTPLLLASFTIVNNDGIEAVVGTFVGQAEGSSILVGGMTFRISYIGGTGNDVTLTRIA